MSSKTNGLGQYRAGADLGFAATGWAITEPITFAVGLVYANLVGDAGLRDRLWAVIEAEYQYSSRAVLVVTGEVDLLDGIPWLKESIRVRNPNTDPLNFIQVEELHHLRVAEAAGDREAAARATGLLRLTTEGVAAGMRSTG